MSTLTLDQAKAIAATAYEKYFPASYGMNLNNHTLLFQLMDGLAAEQALKIVLPNLIYLAAINNPSLFPGHTATIGKATEFVESLPSSTVVNFLYPQASTATKAQIVTALDNGSISKENFSFGFLKLGTTNTAPTLADVTKAATIAGLADSYPDSGLHMPGVTDAQQDFVVAMYAAAFSRAPEYNGLKYWTNKLSIELGYGTAQSTAYKVVSAQMYSDGKGNSEGGTTLGDAAYVTYAYQNILGRNGEPAGVSYWNTQLSTGAVDRGTFVATFVGDALGNAGDGDFLQARIAVSKFAAQQHVSGPTAPGIDLHAVIQSVTNATSANAAISAIIQKYGNAPASTTSFEISSYQPNSEMTGLELSGATSVTYDAFGLVA